MFYFDITGFRTVQRTVEMIIIISSFNDPQNMVTLENSFSFVEKEEKKKRILQK